jgi:HEAT repeat protein
MKFYRRLFKRSQSKPTGPKDLDELFREIKHPDASVRCCALEQIKERKELVVSSRVREISLALRDSRWEVRIRAAELLGILGFPDGINPLVMALADESVHVRHEAAISLGGLGDIRAFRPLVGICADGGVFAAWYGVKAAKILRSLLENHAEILPDGDLLQASTLKSYEAIHDDTGGAWIDGKTISQMASNEFQRREHLSTRA